MSLQILNNISLKDYTSWLVGGSAEFFCIPQTEAELIEALLFAKKNNLSRTVIGGGSNVLVSDQGIYGLTICTKKLSGITSSIEKINEQDFLVAEVISGTAKSELLKLFLKHQLSPALFLAGLPGDVAGGVVMNAGVAENFQPREFMELVEWIEVVDVDNNEQTIRKTFATSELKIEYRHTFGWQPHVISKVKIKWPLLKDETILQKVREANKSRLTKQPLDMPSCGSVFKNPEGYKAAQLIDGCGLKGFQIGDAQVSLKHANFIVNLGNAKANEIWSVINHVQQTVFKLKGVQLKTEVVRLGEWV